MRAKRQNEDGAGIVLKRSHYRGDQQGQPLTLGIGSHVVEALAHRFEAPQIVMLIEQLIETLQFGAFYKPHLNLV